MAMTFNKYQCFPQDIGKAMHNLDTDVLKIALSNTAPNAATHLTLADITEIAAGNGYVAGGNVVANNAWAQTGGVGQLSGDDVTFTAAGGAIATWRYLVLYNDTHASNPLIGWFDYGVAVNLQDGASFLLNLPAVIMDLT